MNRSVQSDDKTGALRGAGSPTRKLASGSLMVMGAGFLALLPFQNYPVGKLLSGAFEAGLVGGLADWFAVTALFRHPLGIPIPHTALLPRNRKKLTEGLVSMVQDNLLAKDSIVDKLSRWQPAERIVDYAEKKLAEPAFRSSVKSAVVAGLSKPLDGAWSSLRIHAVPFIQTQDWVGLLLSARGDKQPVEQLSSQLLDYAVGRSTRWIVTDDARLAIGRLAIQAISGLRMNGLMQFAVNAALNVLNEDQIGGAIQQTLIIKLRELDIPGHPTREAAVSYMSQEWLRLTESEEVRHQWNSELRRLLTDWVEGQQSLDFIQSLQQNLYHKVLEESLLEDHIFPFLEKSLHALRINEALMASIHRVIQDTIVKTLEVNHPRIGSLVKENVEKLDNKTLISLVEDKVGKDLQWIRVNGAVCGFILGLIFTTLRMIAG